MPSDLYAALGVKRKANKAMIRKAYKKAAMQSHPDMPNGNPQKFALVKRAHDILIDDQRRAKYDATGDESEKSPDNAFSGAMNCVAFALNAVLADCAQQGASPLERDLISAMRTKVNANISELEKQVRVHNGILEFDMKLKDRFRRKKKADGMDVMGAILGHRIAGIRTQISQWENGIKDGKAGLALLEEWSFKADQPDPSEARGGITFMQMGRW
jgi:curved DNA-binding protein CbpA